MTGDLATLLTAAVLLAAVPRLGAQTPAALAVPPDSSRWILEGNAQVTDYLGRRCLMLDGGAATVRDFELHDAVIDLDVATSAVRGFFGLEFRIDSVNAEFIYLRPHKSGLPDAVQYTPVLNTGLNWQLYSGAGFTAAVDVPRDRWFHLRLDVAGAQARLYVHDMNRPALVIPDLKSGLRHGQLALADLIGATCFSNVEIRASAGSSWERRFPPMPPGTLVTWSISPALDALGRNLEHPLSSSERAGMQWQAVEAEPPGLVALYRYREAPHPRVTFQNDFSRRLEPQTGMKVVYARTDIPSERDQVKKLQLGYSDEVSVFLNGQILFRGRSAQGFRDPGFLGIMDPENDAVYLPLRKGRNELLLAVSELGGGWGFTARLAD